MIALTSGLIATAMLLMTPAQTISAFDDPLPTQNFACTRSSDPVRNLICQFERLGRLEAEMNARYVALKAELSGADLVRLEIEQADWQTRLEDCDNDLACRADVYRVRIYELQSDG